MKIWLTFMAGEGDKENLEELILPVIEYFDGLVATYHGNFDDEAASYIYHLPDEMAIGDEINLLMGHRKRGKINVIPYSQRHDLSRNVYLHSGPMKNGDWFIQIDTLERLDKDFAKGMQDLITEMKKNNLNALWYEGKPFLIEYHESLIYAGSPHEGLHRQDGNLKASNFSWEKEVEPRVNVRPLKRPDPKHWINHYLRYYLFPWGSNHCVHGLDHRAKNSEDLKILFQQREKMRLNFLDELEKRGFDRTVDGVIQLFQAELDDTMKHYLNNEKILQDVYRHHIMKDMSTVDEHKNESMITI